MKTNENGRSMVEMLGVLAIIGVLSVGAIAGYSKAMFKYKMNKTLDILSHAVNRVVELETMNVGSIDLGSTADMVKYGIIPDCDVNYIDINGETGGFCPLPLGEFAVFLTANLAGYIYGEFYITFLQEPFDSCIAFFNSGIYKNVPEDWWYNPDTIYGFGIKVGGSRGKIVYGKSESAIAAGAKDVLTNQDILDACDMCKNGEYCEIYWVIRNEY